MFINYNTSIWSSISNSDLDFYPRKRLPHWNNQMQLNKTIVEFELIIVCLRLIDYNVTTDYAYK